MPLAATGLKSQLASIAADPPATAPACAQAWADAVQAYAAGIVPPSTTVSAASATLAGDLSSAFQSSDAAPAMEIAFAAFAVSVGGGMAGFVPTPPAGPVGFGPQFAGPKPETHGAAGEAIGGLIDTWLRTGTATPAAGGSPIPWS